MSEHIVIILDRSHDVSEALKNLKTLLPGVNLEPQFQNMAPVKTGEAAVQSEMRRTLRFACSSGVDADILVRRLQASPMIERVYHERESEPANLP